MACIDIAVKSPVLSVPSVAEPSCWRAWRGCSEGPLADLRQLCDCFACDGLKPVTGRRLPKPLCMGPQAAPWHVRDGPPAQTTGGMRAGPRQLRFRPMGHGVVGVFAVRSTVGGVRLCQENHGRRKTAPQSPPAPTSYPIAASPSAKGTLYRWEKLGLIALLRVGAKTLISAETVEDILAGRIALPRNNGMANPPMSRARRRKLRSAPRSPSRAMGKYSLKDLTAIEEAVALRCGQGLDAAARSALAGPTGSIATGSTTGNAKHRLDRSPKCRWTRPALKHAGLRAYVLKKIDPVGERRSAKVLTPGGLTFGWSADQYLDRQERLGRLRNRKNAQQWRSTLASLPASFRDLRINPITPHQVYEALNPIWRKTLETASRLRGRIEIELDSIRGPTDMTHERADWSGWLKRQLGNPKKLGKLDHKTGLLVARSNHPSMPYADVPAFMSRLSASDKGRQKR